MVGVADTVHLVVIEDEQRRAVAVKNPSDGQGGPRNGVNPIRLVIDLALPGLSGVELLLQLRRVDRAGTSGAGHAPPVMKAGVLDRRFAPRSAGPEVNVVVVEERDGNGGDEVEKVEWWSRLTSAEVEVALLAAAGLTNRQISERLFTSPRTTESHLAHVYRKLGISGRTQLAAESARRAK